MIRALAHVCFTVRDLEASIAFYCGILGLTHVFDFVNEEGHRFGAYLQVSGRSFIELFQGEVADDATSGSFRHICLEVEDIQQAVAKLRKRGVEVSDPTLGSDNSWQAWLSDPDGNRLELHCYTPDSRQTPWLE